jgi:hypothetical protein
VKKEQKRSLEETLSTGDMQRMKAIPGVRLSSFAHSPLSQTRLLLLPPSSKQICFVPGQRSSQLQHVRKFTAPCYHQETRSEWKRTWSHLLLRPLASLPRAETSRAAPETKELSESRETKEGLASSLAYDATKEKDDRSQQPPETTAAAEEEEEAGLACTDDDATKPDKPEMCTADELHYVSVPGTDWRLALWRYLPASDRQQQTAFGNETRNATTLMSCNFMQCVRVCALHTGTEKKPSHLDALWHWHKCLLF